MNLANKSNRSSLSLILCALLFAGTACGQRFSQWSQPVNLGPIVNSLRAEFFAGISKDGLSLYFTASLHALGSDTVNFEGWDIYVSQRASTSDPWGPPQMLGPEINTPTFSESAPVLSVDGHTMYFASDRPGGFGGNDIWVSHRKDNRDDFGWEAPRNLGSNVNTIFNEAAPAIFEDDETGVTTLYFDSNRPGGLGPFINDGAGNGTDIYSSILGPDGTFGPATLIPELSTTFADRQPSISRDGLQMYLASNRPGTLGGLDLWVATRASTSDVWSAPTNLGSGVNSSVNDAGPAISFDGTTLYFHSIRSDNFTPFFELHSVTRTKLKGGKDEDD
jgi:WD40-like Beta Propeller Repeat